MALHGTVYVNTKCVGMWEAQRTEPLRNRGAVHTYRCRYVATLPDGSHAGWSFDVRHRYSDGAGWLAALVTGMAARLQNGDPLIDVQTLTAQEVAGTLDILTRADLRGMSND